MYCPLDIGRPGIIDPVSLFKIVFIQYLFGIAWHKKSKNAGDAYFCMHEFKKIGDMEKTNGAVGADSGNGFRFI